MPYGFRLFETELVEHHRNSPEVQPWELPDKTHYVDHAEAALDLLCSASRRLEAKPTWNHGREQSEIPPYSAGAGQRVVRWLGYERVGQYHLRATLGYGTVGSHESGLAEDAQDDADLANLAPSNVYRVELLFPRDDRGGLLVVETNGRACPFDAIPRWLTVAGEILGGTPTSAGGSERITWKLRTSALLDREHLAALLMEGEKVQLNLRGTAPPGSGISSGPPVRLEIEVDTQVSRQNMIKKLMDRMQGLSQSPSDLLAVVELDDQLDDFDFQDGSIRVEDASGEAKTILLNKIEEVFTYPTKKDLRPTAPEWTAAARTKVGSVRSDLEW